MFPPSLKVFRWPLTTATYIAGTPVAVLRSVNTFCAYGIAVGSNSYNVKEWNNTQINR